MPFSATGTENFFAGIPLFITPELHKTSEPLITRNSTLPSPSVPSSMPQAPSSFHTLEPLPSGTGSGIMDVA